MAFARKDSYDRMPLALAALLGVFVIAGLAVATLISGGADPRAPTLPDLSGAQLVEIRDASGRTILTGEFRSHTDPIGNVEKDAALVDRRGRRVIGHVEVELPGPQSMHQPQELEIDIIGIAPSAKFSVFIDDREAATFITDDRGHVDVEISGAAPATGARQP